MNSYTVAKLLNVDNEMLFLGSSANISAKEVCFISSTSNERIGTCKIRRSFLHLEYSSL